MFVLGEQDSLEVILVLGGRARGTGRHSGSGGGRSVVVGGAVPVADESDQCGYGEQQ